MIRRVLERRLTQVKAAEILGLGARQVGRLCAAYGRHGPPGLVSRQRGKASNRRLPLALQMRSLDLVRERYADFGPTLAAEKLLELHGVDVARETLRKWMAGAGIWLTGPTTHQSVRPKLRKELPEKFGYRRAERSEVQIPSHPTK